jgi:hypothetical protein
MLAVQIQKLASNENKLKQKKLEAILDRLKAEPAISEPIEFRELRHPEKQQT